MRDFENLTCRSTQLLLWDYLTGRLPEERMEDVERHLAACESCRVELESMKETHQWLRIAYSSEVPEPRSGWHTLRARLVQEELIPATSKRHTVPVVLLALLFLLPGFLAGRLLPHERTPKPTGLASTSVPSPGLTSEPSIIAPPHSDTVASSLLGLDNPTISTAEDDTVTAPPVKRHQSTKSEEHHPQKHSSAPKNVPTTKSFKHHSSVVPTSNAPVLASKSEASTMTSSQVAKAPSATQNTTAEAQFVLTGLQPDSPDRQTIY